MICVIAMFGIPAIFFCSLGFAYAQGDAAGKQIRSLNYAFTVPHDWQRGSSTDAEQIKQDLTSAAKTTEGNFTISEVFPFSSPQGCLVVIYETQLLSTQQSADYLHTLYQNQKEKLQYGVEQGIVKAVYRNDLTTINGLPSVVVDWEGKRGKNRRVMQYIVQSPDLLKTTLQVSAFCSATRYKTERPAIARVVNSLVLTKKAP